MYILLNHLLFTLRYSSAMLAAVAACMLTRRCAKLAFAKYGRCTMTTRMIDEIGSAFDELFTSSPS